MKKIPVTSWVSLGVTLLFTILIIAGGNVAAFEFQHASPVMKVLSYLCFIGSIILPMLVNLFDLSKNENWDIFLKVILWGILLVLGFLFGGYISTEYNNPYL